MVPTATTRPLRRSAGRDLGAQILVHAQPFAVHPVAFDVVVAQRLKSSGADVQRQRGDCDTLGAQPR